MSELRTLVSDMRTILDKTFKAVALEGSDRALFFASVDRAEAELDALERCVAVLEEARPYVFTRTFPLGHPMRDARAGTAEDVLGRVDEALTTLVAARSRT